MDLSDARRLLARLDAHRPFDADEASACTTLRAFVESCPTPFSRATPAGHVTASAVVLDPDGRALLLFHAKLAIWVQPGGHVEPSDPGLAEAALREAREESGLGDLCLAADPSGAPLLLDVDVHPIPANTRRGEPAHLHHDTCFLVRTTAPSAARIDPDESHGLRWVAGSDLEGLALDRATRRRLTKAFAIARDPAP